ncbi:MAG: DNA polymerase III subunit delta [Bacteroidales bacterium]|nr:DNA polymerase III subunit delta [Bacteroidales bacterium]
MKSIPVRNSKGKKEILHLQAVVKMLFKEIIGQQEVKNRLLNMVRDDRTPHALLLFGPPGTGKLALAVAMAQYLSCNDRQREDACGVCPSCVKFGKLVHPDLHFVVPVLKTVKVAKDPVSDHFMTEWREVFISNPYISESQWYEAIGVENKQGSINKEESLQIIKKLGFKPYESEYKMMIIWLPEKMNQAAANKLLKQIEEPPDKTLILMVSENTDRILPTILSRTQLLLIPPLSESSIREGLLQQDSSDQQMVDDAIRKSNGNFNRALQTLRKDENELQYFELFSSLMRLCYSKSIIEINDWVDKVAGLGRERQKQLVDYSLKLLRENFMLSLKQEDLNFMSRKEDEFSRRFSPFIHGGNIHTLVETFSLAGNHIEANGNPRVILMDLSIKVIRLLMQKAPHAD